MVGCYMYTETVDGLLAIATVVVVDGFGWTTFAALARKRVSHSVRTGVGAVTTVDIMKMSPSRVTRLRKVCSP